MRASIVATALAAMLSSAPAIALPLQQPMTSEHVPGVVLVHGAMDQGMMSPGMMGQGMPCYGMSGQGMPCYGMGPGMMGYGMMGPGMGQGGMGQGGMGQGTMGPGMMGPGMMGPGMMGQGMMGPGMMGPGMMGPGMMGPGMMGPGMMGPGSQGMMGPGMMGPGMMGPGMMGQGMMGQGVMGQGMMPMMGMMMDPAQYIENRIVYLKSALNITDAQAPQWDAYAEALRGNAKRIGEMMSSMMSRMHGQGGGLSVPDRLASAEEHVKLHMDMLQAIKGPTTQLYDVLSDQQKRIADQLLGPMGMMGMM